MDGRRSFRDHLVLETWVPARILGWEEVINQRDPLRRIGQMWQRRGSIQPGNFRAQGAYRTTPGDPKQW